MTETIRKRDNGSAKSNGHAAKPADTNASPTAPAREADKAKAKEAQRQMKLLREKLKFEKQRGDQLSEIVEEWRTVVGDLRSQLVEKQADLSASEAGHAEEIGVLQAALAKGKEQLMRLTAERDAAIRHVSNLNAAYASAEQRATSSQSVGGDILLKVNRRLLDDTWKKQAESLEKWMARPRPRKRFAYRSRTKPFVSVLRRFSVGRSAILFFSGLHSAPDGPGGRNLVRLGRGNPGSLGPHPLFDIAHYATVAQDLNGGGAGYPLHYLFSGDREGRSPHPLFDVSWYRERHADALAGWPLTTLEHFITRGAFEGRDPHPLFDVTHYVSQVPELAVSGRNPLAHYLAIGWREGFDPHPLFSNDWYLEQYPDVMQAGIAPLLHYVSRGAREHRDPHPLFSTAFYLQENPDVAAIEINPLIHYVEGGWREDRRISPHFDAVWYLQSNRDVAEAGLEPFMHYLTRGAWENRPCAEGFDEASFSASHPELVLEGRPALEAWVRAGKPRTAAARPPSAAPGLLSAPSQAGFQPVSGDGALFTQLYNAAREKDPNAYNWPTYEALSTSLKTSERKRIEALNLKPAKLIDLQPEDITRAPATIRFKPVETPAVSIVIPVYNAVKFTLECLKSLEKTKSKSAFEVIIIDDASTDETEKLVSGIQGVRYLRNAENLGFLKTVNRAVGEARGDRLVILNNDVQVEPDWLDPLLAALEDETVGVVAPMMKFPNGRLQEAGARLEHDGSSRMIGLFDDPDLPRYNYARDVDYVSGACICVRRDEFLELGGFDLAYAPAYCEDCDLCFRYAERGQRIRYEPASKIYHHLSVSSNAQPGAFKMRQIRRNQQKLVSRWTDRIADTNDVRVISFYLPQFHTIPENDRWWGAGFTEWSNAQRALPNFDGHYQPHRPAELGYYDLANPVTMERQAELAKQHGVDGFCFYYYWFSGRRVLEAPLERMLETGKPDMPFCICWANENWTRTWDGQNKDILLAQKYRKQDDKAIILDMIRFMRSENYIRVNGKPLLVVYRPQLLPNPERTADLWRQICRDEGIGEIYLCFVETFENALTYPDPKVIGYDATIEFPPSGVSVPIPPPGPQINPNFTGTVSDYRKVVERYVKEPLPAHTRFRGVMPSWDNSARRQDKAYIFHHASPGAFQAWLEQVIEQTKDQNSAGERLVFVNAWNEWAEGAHLEPDEKFGRAWLEAVRNARESSRLLNRS